MASKVRFHPEAANEIVAASDWYRERSEVAARAFLVENGQAIKNIRKSTFRYPLFQNDTRRLVLPRTHSQSSIVLRPRSSK